MPRVWSSPWRSILHSTVPHSSVIDSFIGERFQRTDHNEHATYVLFGCPVPILKLSQAIIGYWYRLFYGPSALVWTHSTFIVRTIELYSDGSHAVPFISTKGCKQWVESPQGVGYRRLHPLLQWRLHKSATVEPMRTRLPKADNA
jgi:hypothetical protein